MCAHYESPLGLVGEPADRLDDPFTRAGETAVASLDGRIPRDVGKHDRKSRVWLVEARSRPPRVDHAGSDAPALQVLVELLVLRVGERPVARFLPEVVRFVATRRRPPMEEHCVLHVAAL